MAESSEEVGCQVKSSLVQFIKRYTGQDVESAIDDILVTYLMGMLEPEALEDCFNVEELREMLAAYFPEVDQITDGQLAQWVHDMSELLSTKAAPTNGLGPLHLSFTSPLPQQPHPCNVPPPQITNGGGRRTRCTSNCSSDSQEEEHKAKIDEPDFNAEAITALTEMFPHRNSIRIRKCLAIAKGDLDTAAQLLLQDEGMGRDELLISSTQMTPKIHIDQKTLREQLLNKYAYVDAEEAQKEHKPVVHKAEPKKLIRYRDNKVVSVKGERFTMEQKRSDVEN